MLPHRRVSGAATFYGIGNNIFVFYIKIFFALNFLNFIAFHSKFIRRGGFIIQNCGQPAGRDCCTSPKCHFELLEKALPLFIKRMITNVFIKQLSFRRPIGRRNPTSSLDTRVEHGISQSQSSFDMTYK